MKKNTEATATATVNATETKRARRTPAKEMATRYIDHLKRQHETPALVKQILDAFSVVGVITALDAFNMVEEYVREHNDYINALTATPYPVVADDEKEGGAE